MTSQALNPDQGDDIRLSETQLAEVMTAVCINGTSYAVMLTSPFDLEDFARGFALGEALVQSVDEIRDIVVATTTQGITIDLTLSPRASHAAKTRQRNIHGTTSCGLCGADAIALALPDLAPNAAPPYSSSQHSSSQTIVPEHTVMAARAQLSTLQTRNRASCGGMHAAALFNHDGSIIAVREDVGRHNALDKLIGASAAHNRVDNRADQHANRFVLLTSRCSYELVLKCARARIGTLITLAGPTTLAVQYARKCNLSLACFIGNTLQHFHIAT